MSLWEILLVGIALSMDAVAVAAASAMNNPNMHRREALLLACAFGGFQGLMPLLGYYTGTAFNVFMSTWAPFIACLLLVIVGGKMIRDSIHGDTEALATFTLSVVLLEAVATSIDAMAVGVSMAAGTGISIISAVSLIAATTFVLTLLAVRLSRLCGNLPADKAGILGGVILLIIGIKMLF